MEIYESNLMQNGNDCTGTSARIISYLWAHVFIGRIAQSSSLCEKDQHNLLSEFNNVMNYNKLVILIY